MANTPNSEVYPQKNQISDNNPDGLVIGQSATDLVAFYGKVPQAQRVNVEVIQAASIITSAFSTAGGTTAQSALTAFTSQFGNWATTSQSVNGASTSWYATAYAVSNASVISSNASFLAIQANILGEVCKTLVGLGIWKGV
jgi:hypothetical protein